MFGFFNKAKQIKTLTGLLLLQYEILKDLVNILKDMNKKNEESNTEILPNEACGEWIVKSLGICLLVTKEKDKFYASVRDIDSPAGDYKESHIIRTYNNICYFILESYAIFVEYDKDKNQINLCGNLSLIRPEADLFPYPAIPLDFNLN
ncbi:hypothetical protein IR083_00145 [Dysgonomonas sp. GY75]|uniref:hypothetical protein n=1 Tax=Dysgonomonas sp. GY75 TaxID=2780419 RepID=UPI0018838603|nr:hypothetical protein [Dysgonomonas sp. GY75]MBF0647231.1 hypothetical protein [Dysgonomonas sp. GY75]